MTLLDLSGRTLTVGGELLELAVGTHLMTRQIEIAVSFEGAPRGTITVPVHGVDDLADGEILAKTSPQNALLIDAARATGWFETTGRRVDLGFCVAEVWRLS